MCAWIINYDATNNMTIDSRHVSYLNSSSQKFISTINGTCTLVIGDESLTSTNTINLDSI